MANEGKIELNNGETVVKRFEDKTFPEKFCRMQIKESGIGEVTISEESIRKDSEFIVNLFDEQ